MYSSYAERAKARAFPTVFQDSFQLGQLFDRKPLRFNDTITKYGERVFLLLAGLPGAGHFCR